MIKLIVLALLFAVACAQFGQRCKQTPSTWNGLMREVNYDARGSEASYRFAHIDYDAVGQRIHILEYYQEADGRREEADELFLFQEEKFYRAERGGECRIEPLNTAFRPFGVPSDAEFEGVEFLGALSSTYGLLVDEFHYRDQRVVGGGSARYEFAPASQFDLSSCYPVEMSFVNLEGPLPFRSNVHFTFLNITAGVPSGAFNIPSNCNP